MAVIPAEVSILNLGGVKLVTWADMQDGDTGEPVQISPFPDRTVQATGDGTVTVAGSNDGTNFGAVADPSGDPIALVGTTHDIAMIRENPLFVQPTCSGGTGTTVTLIGTSQR